MQGVVSLRHLSKKYAVDVTRSLFVSPHYAQTSTSIVRESHRFSSSLPGSVHNPLVFTNPRKLLDGFNRKFSYLGRGRTWRSSFNRLTSENVVYGLIAVNIGVFTLWRVADRHFMVKNFMISLGNFQSGRLHTMVTSAFSHIDFGHLFSNMLGLFFFGMNIGRTFGPEFLLKLYLAGAIGGSTLYLIYHFLMPPNSMVPSWKDPRWTPGLGASGAVNAIMLLDIFLNPTQIIYFNLLIPVPAMLLGIFMIGQDLWRMNQGDTRISGAAHLGGAAVAALAWLRIKKGRF